jgi:anti-sigma regulatory factor (Ser/Thr protein kinase)
MKHASNDGKRGASLDVGGSNAPQGTLLLQGTAGDPARCRDLVRGELGGEIDDAQLDEILLVVSELIANGVLHARTPLVFRLRTREEGVVVTVEDLDDTSGFGPVQTHEWSTQGRGLTIVDRLADRWGITPLPGGKVVWAMFERAVPQGYRFVQPTSG